MVKKILLTVLAVLVITGSYFFLFSDSKKYDPNGYCAFCDPKVLKAQSFYEDDLVYALYTHKPIVPGHCLIIPKRHVERFEGLTDEEACQICRVIKKVHLAAMKVFGTTAYLLAQKNGWEVGQSVPHVHFHYVPRKKDDRISHFFWLQMYIANVSDPISSAEMQDVVDKMRVVMNSLE